MILIDHYPSHIFYCTWNEGSDAVVWMKRELEILEDEAIEFGQLLLEDNHLEYATDERNNNNAVVFKNSGDILYRWKQ